MTAHAPASAELSAAVERAGQQFPTAWYERGWLLAGCGIVGGTALQMALWLVMGYAPPSWLAAAAIVAYASGFLFDVFATHRHIKLNRAFARCGLQMPSCEVNSLLADYPTLWQQVWNRATLFSALFLFLVPLMPVVGVGAATMHVLAGASNLRARKRSEYILLLAKSAWRQTGSLPVDKKGKRAPWGLALSENLAPGRRGPVSFLNRERQ